MGVGMPEYVLLFRKPPSDRSDGYADRKVAKAKKEWKGGAWVNPDGYSRARWQLDAHGLSGVQWRPPPDPCRAAAPRCRRHLQAVEEVQPRAAL